MPEYRERVVAAAGIACAALGMAVIAGWHLGIHWIIQVGSISRAMPYDSAIGFGLTGAAMIALARRRPHVVRWIAGIVIAGALVVGVPIVNGHDYSIEHLLRFPYTAVTRPPGPRVPPNAVLGFALASCALWLASARRQRHAPIGVAGSLITGIGLTTLLGYATHLSGAYSWAGLPPMAFHGACGFVVIGVTLMVVAWPRRMAADETTPNWLPIAIAIGTATMTVVLWQALVDDRTGPVLARMTLGTGLTLAVLLALSIHLAAAAKGRLREAERSRAELEAEVRERKHVEEALRASETNARVRARELQAVLDAVPAAVFLTRDSDARRIDVNHFGAELLQVAPGENVSKSALHDEHYPAYRCMRHGEEIPVDDLPVQLAARTGATVRAMEFDILTVDGTVRTLLGNAEPLRDADGQVSGAVGAFVDITERNRAKELLQRSQEERQAHLEAERGHWQAVVQGIADELWICDVDGTISLINVGTVSPAGLAQFSGTSVYDVTRALETLEPDGRPRAPAAAPLVRSLQGETVHADEILRDRQSGRRRHRQVTSSPIRDTDGRITGAVAVVRDTTQHHELTAAVRDSEQRLRAIFDHAGVGIVEVDADNRFIAANDCICKILGYRRRDLVGSSELEITAPEDRPRSDNLNARLRAGEYDRFEDEKRYLRRDGTAVWVHVVASGIRDRDGRFLRAITTVENISERKQAEQDLKESDRRKDEFLATLAHELRNPLAPIRLAVTLLQRQPLDEAGSRARGIIDRQLRHLVRLVDDLLDVSRITRNKIQLRREMTALDPLMRAALESVEPQSTTARVTLKLECDSTLVVDADPARLVQVFTNLLTNAIKFTSSGGHVEFLGTSEDGSAVVRVRDSGVGISPAALPHIFDMFHQAENSLERSVGGLGIGLTLSKRLVEMHQGHLEARSDGVGLGAEFTVRLPLASLRELEDASPAAGHVSDSPRRTLRVLVVEDNHDAAEMLETLVVTCGHTASTVHDGVAALAEFDRFQPEVVLLDIGLPGMNGYEVAKRLSAARTRGVRMVAITGWGQEEDRRRARESGFDAHFTKPADPDALMQFLADVAAAAPGDLTEVAPRTRHSDTSSRAFQPPR